MHPRIAIYPQIAGSWLYPTPSRGPTTTIPKISGWSNCMLGCLCFDYSGVRSRLACQLARRLYSSLTVRVARTSSLGVGKT